MQKALSTQSSSVAVQMIGSGKPTIPVSGRQTVIERKISDPSSSFPQGERLPIPAFIESRIQPRDYDPLRSFFFTLTHLIVLPMAGLFCLGQ